ncbi:spermidine synthase [Crossiella sp. SN42]|uniref:spermidine synthase n=1 Tax=Crossiella sp. SN42 TaxID=2944808 RepID=UPI00207C1D07|nr:spermidine synthase [Crossiella sp. SN42]MCO1574190.1 spermidine synthase [Crossiella sp. SN42]
MSSRFQVLDWCETSLGVLMLRRRWDPAVDREVYEIKLNDEFLMSSLFTVAEVELAHLALAELPEQPLDVLVGGLGLGCTAKAVLEHPNVRSLFVVDALPEVIGWHQRGLIPAGAEITADSRCELVHGDFFAMSRSPAGFDLGVPGRRWHAIVVDIDHSPRHLLHAGNADFYQPDGLRRLAERLHPGGVFALWSNDPPDEEFTAVLGQSFVDVAAKIVNFPNPFQDRESANTVYLARKVPL